MLRPEALSREPAPLLGGLPFDCGLKLLEARGSTGWTSPLREPRTESLPGLQILALDPEVEFRGGRRALEDALAWLRPTPGMPRWDRVLIGSLSYELGREFEPLAWFPEREAAASSVDLAGFRAVYVFDPSARRGQIHGEGARARARLAERLQAACGRTLRADLPRCAQPSESLPRPAFRDAVDSIRKLIAEGEIYQANLTRRLSFDGHGAATARALYLRLRGSGDAPFAAYLESGERAVLSNSPERFLRVEGSSVETGPIKGTRPRGSTPALDRCLARELLASEKDAAEHVMIVDLERNDLGRVCEIGSVEVEPLAALRSFASVHHLVSSVRGRLRRGVGPLELLAATFPGGSITGAPKLRAMRTIATTEPVARDVYTGAIGYFDAAGDLDLSVAIRTAIVRDATLHLHVGAGIVADSDPDAEWLETESKAEAFRVLWDGAP